MARTEGRQFVAIDMPGLGLNDPDLQFEMARLNQSSAEIARILVLPAYLQSDVMDLVLKRYTESANAVGLVLSRLDECCSLGPALSLLANVGIPLAYTTDGPHIPEDIQAGSSVGLVRAAMQLAGTQFAKAGNSDFTNSSSEAVSQL